VSERIERLLAEMTLEEKVALCAGTDLWHSAAIERLGSGAIKVTDGPNGARGASMISTSSACFPCGTALGATWNVDLVRRVGAALAAEARDKGAHVLLAPTVNIHRHPLAGRNFECYSEDPFLAGSMAAAYIDGVQSGGVAATVKHFVANDSEFERMTISSEVDERTLREIYLPPFEAAVRAGVWAVMAAYNRINGIYAAENPLLADVLRGEWGFDGLVMSDWWGTKSTAASANAGLDLEMPGPPLYMGGRLLAAVQAGDVSEATVTEHARRVLQLAERTGALAQASEPSERSIDDAQRRALAHEAAAEAIVLLKNDNSLLPLDRAALRSIAVIGPTADTPQPQGGGSAGVTSHPVVSPLEAIRALCDDSVTVEHEPGCSIARGVPAIDLRLLQNAVGAHALDLQYFDNPHFEGEPVLREAALRPRLQWLGNPGAKIPAGSFSVRATASYTPRVSGEHLFAVAGNGEQRLSVAGTTIVAEPGRDRAGQDLFGASQARASAAIALSADEPVELVLDYVAAPGARIAVVQIGCQEPAEADPVGRAVALAARSDVAVVVVGTTPEWESEGFDRRSLALPGEQDDLVRRVAAVNPRTVVLINAGSPVAMDWIDDVPAAALLWLGGEEMGNAVAEMLIGRINPSGRLPTTLPVRIEDTPAFTNYPGENGQVRYGEGIFLGYRWYDARRIQPRFPFGHGLSYTSFRYGPLQLDRDTASTARDGVLVTASVEVTNIGDRDGSEVVQLYVGRRASRVARPPRELKGFVKAHLAPGETQTARFAIDRRAFGYWDTAQHTWLVEPGLSEIGVGSSSRDLRAAAPLEVQA
jgi:beta-glucosidase